MKLIAYFINKYMPVTLCGSGIFYVVEEFHHFYTNKDLNLLEETLLKIAKANGYDATRNALITRRSIKIPITFGLINLILTVLN